jgi:hypothetical protein
MFLALNKTFIGPFPSIWINFMKSLIMKKNTSEKRETTEVST